ncbi:MAG: DNA repair exonuclease [Candidatus Anammoximicrobium sp.]|nr:DNA repair exonuclease [Candidatus Anammoximicrobium sp.]
MFKFLHAADLHLDSPLRGLDRYDGAPVEEVRGATRRALENLVGAAIDQQVAFVVIAGDVYDGDWPDFNTGLFFVRQMGRLREAGIPVVMISGNHDAENKMTRALELPDNVRRLSARKPESLEGRAIGFGLERLDVVFHGQGFASAVVDENVVQQYPLGRSGAFNVGLLHTSLELTGGEHARYAPCAVADLVSRQYDYWALGHIHKARLVQAEPPIVFPGNIQGRHIRETGAKGCQLVTVDGRGQPALEFVPLDVFRWHELTVAADGAARADDVLGRINQSLQRLVREQGELPLAVRVIVTGRCPAHRTLAAAPEAWANHVRAAALTAGEVWVEKVQFQTAEATAAVAAARDEGPLRELAALIAELNQDDQRLLDLTEELAAFKRRLPPELLSDAADADPLRLEEPAFWRTVLGQVEPLLRTRLMAEEGTA